MSDLRRRRKQSGGSDDLSDSYELNVTKETQNSEHTDGHRDSEYDTAGSEGDSDGDSQDGGERESGDGQEEDKPQRKLDDDEDRRNPQYIPKRGTFYEHDDRTTEETSESAAEPPPERETKEKKVWKDKEDRWNHDRYNDDEQAPKSHEELIAVYGYDIRNEEGPPRARRRRRYGRGPNKYTRNWEDEDAYGKTAPNVTSGKNSGKKTNKSGEEFPALGGLNKEVSTESVDEPVITSAWYSNKNKPPIKQQNFPPLQPQQDNNQKSKSGSSNPHSNENRAPNEPTNPAWKKESKAPTRNLSPNRNVVNVGGIVAETDKLMNVKPMTREPKDGVKKRQVQESVSLAASKSRGRGFRASPNNNLVGNRSIDLKPKGRGFGGVLNIDAKRNNITSLHDEDQHQHLVNDTKHMSLNDGSYHTRQSKNFYAQSPGQQRPNTVPPRMQPQQPPHPQHHQQQLQSPEQPPQQVHPQQSDVAGNRPKRYSSLRQRPTIPEGPGQQQPSYPTQHPQHGFYPPQGFPQSHFEQAAPVGNSPAPMTGQPVIPLTPGGQPSGYAPPPFLVPPPQFITPQAAPPNIINYVPTPAGPPFQPSFQGYQGYNPTVQPQGPPPPPELFQPQGCTYYSPAQQQQQQQGAPIRRPKAAIPILPPPDTNTQYQQQHHHQTAMGRDKQSHHRHLGGAGNISLSTSQPLQSTTLQHEQGKEQHQQQLQLQRQQQQMQLQQLQQQSVQQSQQQLQKQPQQHPQLQPEQQLLPLPQRQQSQTQQPQIQQHQQQQQYQQQIQQQQQQTHQQEKQTSQQHIEEQQQMQQEQPIQQQTQEEQPIKQQTQTEQPIQQQTQQELRTPQQHIEEQQQMQQAQPIQQQTHEEQPIQQQTQEEQPIQQQTEQEQPIQQQPQEKQSSQQPEQDNELQQQQDVLDQQSSESDIKNSEEILDSTQNHDKTTALPLNEEKNVPPVVTDSVTTEPETLTATTEPVNNLEQKDDSQSEVRKIQSAAESPAVISSDKSEETVEPETILTETLIIENNEKIIGIVPNSIENDVVVEKTEVTKTDITELNVLPDKPVIEETAA